MNMIFIFQKMKTSKLFERIFDIYSVYLHLVASKLIAISISNLQSDKNDAFEILRYESKENANTLINIKINITKLSTKCLKYEGDKIVDKFKNAIKKIIDINDSNYKGMFVFIIKYYNFSQIYLA